MRIVLIEDSTDIVKTVSLTFRLRWPEAILIPAGKGAKGIKMVETENPDIVILDINLPDMSGFEVLEHIRNFSDVPIIILTVKGDEVDVVRGLETGADDYITKPFSPIDLLARVKAVLRRAGTREPWGEESPPISAGNLSINFPTREVFLGDERLHLTPTEYKILSYVVRNEGKVVTQDAIRTAVWGSGARYQDPSILKKYIHQLRVKLGDTAESPRVIITERGVGYRFIRPE